MQIGVGSEEEAPKGASSSDPDLLTLIYDIGFAGAGGSGGNGMNS